MFRPMQHCDFMDFPKSVKNISKQLHGGKNAEGKILSEKVAASCGWNVNVEQKFATCAAAVLMGSNSLHNAQQHLE